MILKVKKNYQIFCENEKIQIEIQKILNNFISYYIFNDNINLQINHKNYKFNKDQLLQFYYIDLPNNIITKNNIDNFIKNIKDKYEQAFVFGKGPTFESKIKNDKELFFGVNQTVNNLELCDVFCANDLHNIYKVNDFSKIKYIIIPEYLHIDGKFDKNGYWYQVYKYLEDKFTGEIIIFNLRTNKYKNEQFINIPKCKTSSNVAVNFICIYLNKFIKKINTFGTGVYCSQNYNNIFIGNGEYREERVRIIRQEIIDICNYFDIKLKIN